MDDKIIHKFTLAMIDFELAIDEISDNESIDDLYHQLKSIR